MDIEQNARGFLYFFISAFLSSFLSLFLSGGERLGMCVCCCREVGCMSDYARRRCRTVLLSCPIIHSSQLVVDEKRPYGAVAVDVEDGG
jgi:hypothetical protein